MQELTGPNISHLVSSARQGWRPDKMVTVEEMKAKGLKHRNKIRIDTSPGGEIEESVVLFYQRYSSGYNLSKISRACEFIGFL